MTAFNEEFNDEERQTNERNNNEKHTSKMVIETPMSKMRFIERTPWTDEKRKKKKFMSKSVKMVWNPKEN